MQIISLIGIVVLLSFANAEFLQIENDQRNETKMYISSLTENIIRGNIPSAVLSSSFSSVQVNADFVPPAKRSRLIKQEEEPFLLSAEKIIKKLVEKKAGKLPLASYYYRAHNNTVIHHGYYNGKLVENSMRTRGRVGEKSENFRIFSSEISLTQINGENIIVDKFIIINHPVDLTLRISEEEARYIVETLDPSSTKEASVELVVLPSCENDNCTGTLCYLIEQANNNIFFISAQTGKGLLSFKNEPTAFAKTYYNNNQTINTYASPYGNYYMEDLSRNITTLSCNNNCSSITKLIDSNNVWNNTNQAVASQAMWGMSMVLDYFKVVHGRRGLDNNNGPTTVMGENGVTSLLGARINWDNGSYAAWTGTDFVFGNGDGIKFGPMVALDIVAHEMSHAILEFGPNLNPYGQSGALAESFGDITAAVIFAYLFDKNATLNATWTFGEEVVIPNGGGEDFLRYLDEPHKAKNKNFTFDDDPDHVSEMYNGTLDNGGVHVNCGIPNKMFYLLAKGGNHSNGGPTMTGVGIEMAYRIVYKAMTDYWLASSDFNDARSGMLRAARDITGSSTSWEFYQVGTAWGLCGVGAIPTPITNQFQNSGLETVITPWAMSGNGAVYYSRNTAEAKAGNGYVKLGITNSGIGQISQNFSIPRTSAVANLTFWMWISTNDVLTTINDRLYVELKNSTTGSLISQLAIYSNMDATSAYVQKTLNLMSWVGRSGLQIVFRSTCDTNAPTNFRLDEIYMNTVYY